MRLRRWWSDPVALGRILLKIESLDNMAIYKSNGFLASDDNSRFPAGAIFA
ncbi:TPA: hypothetical protein ACVBYD_000670 [Yersinia enterocolitica]